MNENITSESAQVTVYYDNSCPMCREEISALKSMDTANRLRLVDCSTEGFTDPDTARAGLTRSELMQALHVRDDDGQWHSAVDAFVVMYEAVGFDAAVSLLKRKSARSAFERVYPVFVRHRHKLRFTGAHKLMPWLIRRAARKQAQRAAACSTLNR